MGLFFYVPVFGSLIGFVLTILGVFAGNTPGFMEEYQMMVLNTSALGRNYVPALSQATKRGLHGVTILPDDLANATTIKVRGTHANGTDVVIDVDLAAVPASERTTTAHELLKRKLTLAAAEGVLAGLGPNAAADEMAAVLGISQFYSLHVLNLCEGTFAPNATAVGAWYNVSGCSGTLSPAQINMTDLINSQLNGNFEDGGSITRLGGSDSLLQVMNRIPTIGMALAVFYILGAFFAGLAVLLTFVSVVTRGTHARETVLGNLGAAAGAALCLLVSALVLTVAVKSTVGSINRLGQDTIGMQAIHGTKFQTLTWAAFAFMLLSALYWVHDAKSALAKPAGKAAE